MIGFLDAETLHGAITQGMRFAERQRFELERAAERLNTSYEDIVAHAIIAALAGATMHRHAAESTGTEN